MSQSQQNTGFSASTMFLAWSLIGSALHFSGLGGQWFDPIGSSALWLVFIPLSCLIASAPARCLALLGSAYQFLKTLAVRLGERSEWC